MFLTTEILKFAFAMDLKIVVTFPIEFDISNLIKFNYSMLYVL